MIRMGSIHQSEFFSEILLLVRRWWILTLVRGLRLGQIL
jgi:hypothetical protein